MLIAFNCRVPCVNRIIISNSSSSIMTDSSMNFGPAWIRNLRSEGTTGGGPGGGTKYQLAEHRYGREEMLALFDKAVKPPPSLVSFNLLYSEQTLLPLALMPTTEEERGWPTRPTTIGGPARGRGGSLERGGRGGRGRGSYQSYGRATSAYDSSWGNGEQLDWSPRKEFNPRNPDRQTENWRRGRVDEDEGWRNINQAGGRPLHEKWVGRQTSWRGEGDSEERSGPPERGPRPAWLEGGNRGPTRRSWDEDHLPEWATENPTEGGGTFDERGAFHNSDDEQADRISGRRKDTLQKSTSQQHISHKAQQHPSLLSSKSAVSLNKPEEISKMKEEYIGKEEVVKLKETNSEQRIPDAIPEQDAAAKEVKKSDVEKLTTGNRGPPPLHLNIDKSDEEFGRLQEEFGEDFVRKLVVEEDTPKPPPPTSAFGEVTGVAPPPNLVSQQQQDKWFYQDPQGMRQGPFINVEMDEWYKAGYFCPSLNIMRDCDERYYQLADLIALCGTESPFMSNVRFPTMKNDTGTNDVVAAYMTLAAMKNQNLQHPLTRNLTTESWNPLTLPQQELMASQRLLMQPQQNVPSDLQFLTQASSVSNNPLLVMLNQMQQNSSLLRGNILPAVPPILRELIDAGGSVPFQSNKLPGMVEKPTGGNVVGSNTLDPMLVHQMRDVHNTIQNRMSSLHNHMPSGLPSNLSSSLPSDGGLGGALSGLQQAPLLNNLSSMQGLHGAMPSAGLGAANPLNVSGPPRPTSHPSLDQLSTSSQQQQQQPPQDTDSLSLFMKQYQQLQHKMQQVDPLWSKASSTPPMQSQWPQQQSQQHHQQLPPPPQLQRDVAPPISMWDMPSHPAPTAPLVETQNIPPATIEPPPPQLLLKQQQQTTSKEQKEKEQRPKEEAAVSQKELKKRKEIEEKQARKEADEKRKQEQKKQETEKKAAEEKKRKEEEKIRRELEKAKKEAEEKRLRELEEKRRLKEQRKAEEEARKKAEEVKREEDKTRREAREKEERRLVEVAKQNNLMAAARAAKSAPWSQSNSSQGMSLTDIQKAEKEKRAQETAMQLQKQQQMEQQQQLQVEKQGGIQLNWAKKPVETRKVKSVAEIQAEEQERLAKVTAEARLAAQQKEKEAPPAVSSGTTWNGSSLTWANASSTNQWSSNSAGGFWDEVPSKLPIKPSTVSKSNSTSAMTNSVKMQSQQQQKQLKPKVKKEEQPSGPKPVNTNNNNMAPPLNEFTSWCYRALTNVPGGLDVPTFVTFIVDIESAYEVREYCKEYLGDNSFTHQFCSNFLEKRRSYKQSKSIAHKDDMCIPAPAITPCAQHSNEFQEVKGKNKKSKNRKMMKMDKSILGFNVTSAPDRINVGDRDYGDNS